MENYQYQQQTSNTETTIAPQTLREQVLGAIDGYFNALHGREPVNVHSIVLEEVEAAMYESVMKHTRGNQSRAAKLLGVSRGTLRTKLMQYFDTTHVGGVYHR